MKHLPILAASALILSGTASMAQDAEAGMTVFKKCSACHATDATTNKIGPHLSEIVGRTAGAVEGFNYSKAMKDAGAAGLVWDETSLADYLAAPKAKLPGTKMAFAGLKKSEEPPTSSPISRHCRSELCTSPGLSTQTPARRAAPERS